METIIVKPHHLLDIYKLYGAGIGPFVPDAVYGHDFYWIGNLVLEKQIEKICFTVDADMICIPCNFCKDGVCHDKFLHYGEETIKDKYNRALDKMVLELMGLRANTEYDYPKVLQQLAEHISESFINQVWNKNSIDDNWKRYCNTKAGIERLL